MKTLRTTRRNKLSTDSKVYREIAPDKKGWTWLAKRGEYNQAVRKFVKGRNGVYAIRDAETHDVLYVGESHTGRMWKTMLRHFQGQRTFDAIGEWTHPNPEDVQVMVWTTLSGPDAQDLEMVIVSRLAPMQVRGMASRVFPHDVEPDDDDDEPVPF